MITTFYPQEPSASSALKSAQSELLGVADSPFCLHLDFERDVLIHDNGAATVQGKSRVALNQFLNSLGCEPADFELTTNRLLALTELSEVLAMNHHLFKSHTKLPLTELTGISNEDLMAFFEGKTTRLDVESFVTQEALDFEAAQSAQAALRARLAKPESSAKVIAFPQSLRT